MYDEKKAAVLMQLWIEIYSFGVHFGVGYYHHWQTRHPTLLDLPNVLHAEIELDMSTDKTGETKDSNYNILGRN